MPTDTQIIQCALRCAEKRYIPLIDALTRRIEELEAKMSLSQQVQIAPENDTLYNALREKRIMVATEMGIPAYCVATNKMLSGIVAAKPQTLDELRMIYGFGPNKVKMYGDMFLKVVAEWSPPPSTIRL
jgi:ATP-dependent DNA helicase RecQ